jgi:hypothetical protein
MEILGEIVRTKDPEWEIGIPYNPPQSKKFFVNVINRKTREKKIHDFDILELARAFFKEEKLNKMSYEFEISVYDDESNNLIRKEYFFTREEAKIWYKENRQTKKEEIAREYKKQSSFFDKLVGEFVDDPEGDSIKNKITLFGDESEQIKTMEEKYMGMARTMLKSLASTYKQNSLINDGEFKALKLQIEEYNLGNLFYQMWINKRAIDKLMIEIETNKKVYYQNFKVLADLQKVTLDIGKMVHEYMNDIEESFKEASIMSDDAKNPAVGGSNLFDQKEIVTIVRKEFLTKREIPKSKNPSIKPKEDTTYVEFTDAVIDGEENNKENDNQQSSGLESFGDK